MLEMNVNLINELTTSSNTSIMLVIWMKICNFFTRNLNEIMQKNVIKDQSAEHKSRLQSLLPTHRKCGRAWELQF